MQDIILDLTDLQEVKECRLKVKGTEYNVVHLIKEKNNYYAMIAGGYLVEVNQKVFGQLQKLLQEHFGKVVKKKEVKK